MPASGFDWLAIVMGWPAIVLAVLAAGSWRLRWAGPGCFSRQRFSSRPVSLYLAVTPRIGVMGLSSPLFLVAAAVSVHRDRRGLAWVSITPPIVLAGWLAILVALE